MKYTEEDMARAKQEAFVQGGNYYATVQNANLTMIYEHAKRVYPLVKPRVVAIGGYWFRIVDDQVNYRMGLTAAWVPTHGITVASAEQARSALVLFESPVVEAEP